MVSFEDTGDIQKECDRLKDKVKFSSTQSFEIVTCNTSEQPSINYRHCLYTIIHIY